MSTDSAARMRARLVDAATRLLLVEGPGAVQARRVAREVDASTMAVYHYFGGMPELLQAVSGEGFRQLGSRLAELPTTADPIADVCRQALVYRGTAHGSRHLYDLMTGPTATGVPVVLGDAAARDAYQPLIDGVARAMVAGRIRAGEPAMVAAQFWSMLHGFISLELAGQFGEVGEVGDTGAGLTEVLLPMGVNLLVGLGDTRERATASAATALVEIHPGAVCPGYPGAVVSGRVYGDHGAS